MSWVVGWGREDKNCSNCSTESINLVSLSIIFISSPTWLCLVGIIWEQTCEVAKIRNLENLYKFPLGCGLVLLSSYGLGCNLTWPTKSLTIWILKGHHLSQF
jgi:hypothetical protein